MSPDTYTYKLYLTQTPSQIEEILSSIECIFKKDVVLKLWKNDNQYSKLIIESQYVDKINYVEEYLRNRVGSELVLNPSEMLSDRFMDMKIPVGYNEQALKERVYASVEVIHKCFSKYNLNELFLCFNGGKDCTALLHLADAVLNKYYKYLPRKQLMLVYFRSKDPFPEVECFIRDCVSRYNVDLRIYDGPVLNALKNLIKEYPVLKACIMGTRRSDPFSRNLESFQMTDEGWPKVMRVSPLLDWSYSQIWKFLKYEDIPYCTLYDQGYTSIGDKKNTLPNPALRTVGANGTETYLPAFTLEDEDTERYGRLSSAAYQTDDKCRC